LVGRSVKRCSDRDAITVVVVVVIELVADTSAVQGYRNGRGGRRRAGARSVLHRGCHWRHVGSAIGVVERHRVLGVTVARDGPTARQVGFPYEGAAVERGDDTDSSAGGYRSVNAVGDTVAVT